VLSFSVVGVVRCVVHAELTVDSVSLLICIIFLFSLALQPSAGYDFLVFEVS
jgi:hypothetical protein